MSERNDSGNVFNAKEKSKKPLNDIERLAMLLVDIGNTVKHNGDNTQDDGNDEQNIEELAGRGVSFKDDFMQTESPCRKFAVVLWLGFQKSLGTGSRIHAGLSLRGLMKCTDILPVADGAVNLRSIKDCRLVFS